MRKSYKILSYNDFYVKEKRTVRICENTGVFPTVLLQYDKNLSVRAGEGRKTFVCFGKTHAPPPSFLLPAADGFRQRRRPGRSDFRKMADIHFSYG